MKTAQYLLVLWLFALLSLPAAADLDQNEVESGETGSKDEYVDQELYEATVKGRDGKGAKPSDFGTAWRRGDNEGASGATVVRNRTLTFNCNAEQIKRNMPSGTRLRTVSGCQNSGITLQRCDSLVEYNRGCTSSDWSDSFAVEDGNTVSNGNLKLTADCNGERCKMDVRQKRTITADPGSAASRGREKQQAMAKDAEENDGNATTSGVTEMGNSQRYNSEYQTTGNQFAEDYGRTYKGAQQGRVVSGTGEDMGDLGSGYAAQACDKHCIDKTETTSTQTRRCEIAVPHDNYGCEITKGTHVCRDMAVTENKQCQEARDIETLVCDVAWPEGQAKPERNCPGFEQSNTCPSDTVKVACGVDKTFDKKTGTCKGQPSCPYSEDPVTGQSRDYSYDQDKDSCVARFKECPEGFDLTEGEVCEKQVNCPADGYSFNPQTRLCEKRTKVCPDQAYSLNDEGTQCEKIGPTCPDEFRFDQTSGQCEQQRNGCRYGGTFNETSGRCEQPVDCPDGFTPRTQGNGSVCVHNSSRCMASPGDDQRPVIGDTVRLTPKRQPNGAEVTVNRIQNNSDYAYLSLINDSFQCNANQTASWRFDVDNASSLSTAELSQVVSEGRVRVWVNGSRVVQAGSGCYDDDNSRSNRVAGGVDILSYIRSGSNSIRMTARSRAATIKLTVEGECTSNNNGTCPTGTQRTNTGNGSICRAGEETYTEQIEPTEGVVDSKQPMVQVDEQTPQPETRTREPEQKSVEREAEYGSTQDYEVDDCDFVTSGCAEDDPYCDNGKVYTYDCGDSSKQCPGDPVLNAGWQRENIFDRQYRDGRLVSWKQGFSKPGPWEEQGQCAPGQDQSCEPIGVSCTLDDPINRDGVVAEYNCRERDVTYACETGRRVNTCNPGANLPEGACDTSNKTCTSSKELDVRICHVEQQRLRPGFECPTGYDHDPSTNICSGPPDCPDGYSPNENNQCAFDGSCSGDGAPGKELINIVESYVTYPSGRRENKPVQWQAGNREMKMNFSESHENIQCDPGWNYYVKFRVEDKEQLKRFAMLSSALGDTGSVTLNGDVIFKPANQSCKKGNYREVSFNRVLTDSLKEGVNTIHMNIQSGPSSFAGKAVFEVLRYCTLNSECPDGLGHGGQDNACRVLGEPEGGGHIEKNVPYCTAGYTKKGSKCVLSDDACNVPGDQAKADKLIEINESRIVRPNGNAEPLSPTFSNNGKTFTIDYHTQHGRSRQHCGRGFRYYMNFSLPQGLSNEAVNAFTLNTASFDDNMIVRLNGQEVYRTKGFGCSRPTDLTTTNPNKDISDALKPGNNRLVVKVQSIPNEMDMHATFDLSAACNAPLQFVQTKTAKACELVKKDNGRFMYDCGKKPFLKSSCTDTEIAGYNFEKRINEKTNDQGDLVAYDEIYTYGEEMVSPSCAPAVQNGACEKLKTECVESGEKVIDGVTIERQCFKKVTTYDCTNTNAGAACNTTAPPADCDMSGTRCVRRDPDDGSCMIEESVYVCDESGAERQCTNVPNDEANCATAKTECVKENQFGDCIIESEKQSCYSGNPPRCESDKSCTYDTSECVKKENGICKRVEQVYSCDVTQYTCQKTASTCTIGESEDEPDKDSGGLAEVTTAMATAKQVKKGMSKNPAGELTVFSGEPAECTDSTGGDLAGANCCGPSADDESLVGDSCDQEEKDLADAKQAGRNHLVGDYCKTEIDLGFTEICVQTGEGHCQFDNLLARLIQEQGRPQLAEIVDSGNTETRETRIDFPYMSQSPGWNANAQLGDDTVYVWTWDQACSDVAKQAYTDTDLVCPNGEKVWVAHCRSNEGCDPNDLTAPYNHPGNSNWNYHSIDAASGRGTQMGKYAQIAGGCTANEPPQDKDNLAPDTPAFNQCDLKFVQWPDGRRGSARMVMDIGWQLRRPKGVDSNWSADVRTFEGSRYKFQPYQIEPGDWKTMPDRIPIRVAVDDGRFEQYSMPTKLPAEGFKVASNPTTRLFGECSVDYNYCDIKAISEASISKKPWCPGCGEARKSNLDCSGFTIQEFVALDLNEMDLREFSRSIEPEKPDSSVIEDEVDGGDEQFKNDFEKGNEVTPDGRSQTVMRLSPSDGRPPFETKLQLADSMPSTDGDVAINRIDIDWGDGQSTTVDPGTTLKHTYTESDGYREFTVNGTFHLENGQTRTTRAKVVTWKDEPPATTTEYGIGNATGDSYTPGNTSSGNHANELPAPPQIQNGTNQQGGS